MCFTLFVLITFGLICVQAGTIHLPLQYECATNPERTFDAMLDLESVQYSLVQEILKENYTVENHVNEMERITSARQAGILELLQQRYPYLDIKGFWIANRISVKKFPCSLLVDISKIPYTFIIRKAQVANVDVVGDPDIAQVNSESSDEPQWGVKKINAPHVWQEYNCTGKGIVICGIDTGVRCSHESLRGNFRGGDHGWLDGETDNSSGCPYDGHGHGTHTMGSICGQNGYGVAPGAQWIACRGCGSGGCTEYALMTCAQWCMCPYSKKTPNETATRDCSKRAHVINNSWAGVSAFDYFEDIIMHWYLAGIFAVFAAGNFGPSCLTLGYPGYSKNIISVGATDVNDTIASFSSRGPTKTFSIKPHMCAPGKNIVSASRKGNNAYESMSGTSMATPHVSGAIALILGCFPYLTPAAMLKLLISSTYKTGGFLNIEICGCVFNRNCNPFATTFPNNAYGYGRINVKEAFEMLYSK